MPLWTKSFRHPELLPEKFCLVTGLVASRHLGSNLQVEFPIVSKPHFSHSSRRQLPDCSESDTEIG